jgi:poly(glycerol-phosphate) alpha-glucosyltransferase
LLFLGRIHPKKGLVGALRAWADVKGKMGNAKWGDWQFVIAGWDQGGHEAELKALCAELGLRIAVGTMKDTNSHEMEEAGLRLAGQAGAADSENLKLNSYKLKTPSPDAGDADVLFFGPAFGEEKDALLRSADAFVLPSFSEGLPMSVLEAWAYVLPVVMTPECNLPEGFASRAALEIRSGEGSFQGSDFSFRKGLQTLLEMSDHERAAMGMRGRRLVEEKFTWPKVAAKMLGLYEDLLRR